MLNALWVGFFLAAFLIASFKLVFLGDADIFAALVKALFDSSKTAFEIALGLTGVMALWLGVMKIGERAGMLELLTRGLAPLFRRLVSRGAAQPSCARAMTMNMGPTCWDWTMRPPLWVSRRWQELQKLNPSSDTASDAQTCSW